MNRCNKKRLQLLCKLCSRLARDVSEPELHRLSLEQLQYINHRLQIPCYVEACPGSGKTEVIGIKAAYEMATWEEGFCGIAVLTFTRSAASEIEKRVVQYAGQRATEHPHFVGTIDSWLHNYLLQPFGHDIAGYRGESGDKSLRIVDSDYRARFLNNYKVKTRGNAIQANEYYKRHDGKLGKLTKSIDGFRQTCLESAKNRFLRDGFVTYQDAEYICYQVLKRYPSILKLLSRRFPCIIVDECQDLSDTQLYILYELRKAGTTEHLVGDLRQSIYEFRGVNPKHVARFVEKQGFLRKTLTNNYRSNQAIVNVCSSLMALPYRVKGCRPRECDTPCILWQYTEQTFESLPMRFKSLVAKLGLDSQKCCIVARGRSVLKQLHPQRARLTNPVKLFAHAIIRWHSPNRSTADIQDGLHCAGKGLGLLAYSGHGHHQRQYCPEDLDPKAWRIYLGDILCNAGDLHPSSPDVNWSEWAKGLKGYLEEIWSSLPIQGKEWDEVQGRIRSPHNLSKASVLETIGDGSPNSGIRVTTIHDVKGETVDGLLLVSAKNRLSRGGHFEQWLHPEDDQEEHRRFAYVACSRPKHLLVVATPELTESQLEELVGLGLEPQEMPSAEPP